MSEVLNVLGGGATGAADHIIIASQGAGEGFSNVSQYWTAKCMTFAQGREVLAEQQLHIADFRDPLEAWETVVTESGEVAFRKKATGQNYVPTDHALGLMCQIGRGMSDWAVRALRDPIRHATKLGDDGEKKVEFHRGPEDAAVMKAYIDLHLFNPFRVDQKKVRLFRTWDDGTLRALLSDQYAIVNNGWFLDLLEKLIPGGLLSHWKGDADSIYGNILLPDSIRAEKDSDYGGMISIGNSEIGLRRVSSLPSVFRAICMNGCIWEQEKGTEIDVRHRGKIDFEQLAGMIKENLAKQIPLLPVGIDRMLGLRNFGVGETPLRNLFAQLAVDNSLAKKELNGIRTAFAVEMQNVGTVEGMTAFSLLNSVTRFGQTLEAANWVKFDKIGGELANMNRDEWDRFRSRAANLTTKVVDKRLGEEG